MSTKGDKKAKKEKRPADKPRGARSYAKYVRAKKAEIRRTVADPVEQQKQVEALFAGLSYTPEDEIQGTEEDDRD